jgi:hypothetical protein
MDKDVAWSVIRKVFQVSAELQGLMQDLRKTCDAKDYHTYAVAIAATIDRMNVESLDRTLARYPDLEQRIERDIAQHGRLT